MGKLRSNLHNFIIRNMASLKDPSSGNLIIANLYIIVSVFFTVIVFAIEKRGGILVASTALIDFFWILFLYVALHFKAYKVMSVLASVLINLFVFPAFFFMTDGVYNGAALFLCLGIVINFFLIWEKYVYFIMGIELLWDVLVIYFAKKNDLMIRSRMDMGWAGKGITVSFIFAAVVPLFVIIYQTVSYDKEHDNVKKSNVMIEEARLNKSRFLSNMTHEIRTPMNAIVGMNELLLRETEDPVSKELSGHIQESSKQLLKIVNNILEFSKLDSGNMELYLQKYSFKELINGVIENVSNEYYGNGSQFTVSIDPTIPLFLFGDNVRIRQVFMYLLFSSVNKLPHSRMTLTINSERNAEENTVKIKCRISESGSGLSANEIEAMMSAYTKYDSRLKSEYKGMGLELSICKEILENMGGGLEVESVEGVGTAITFDFVNYMIADEDMVRLNVSKEPVILVYTENKEGQDFWMELLKEFRVSLHFVNGPNAFKNVIEEREFSQIFIPDDFYDILKGTVETADIEEKTYILTGRSHMYSDYGKCRIIHYPLSCINVSDALNGVWDKNKYKLIVKKDAIVFPKARVLIVDDSIVNIKVLKGLLKNFKIEPDTAKNADEALMQIDRNIYNLMILDQIMPGRDGIDLLHEIRNLSNSNSRIPIICATADFGPEVGRRLIAEGFQDYLAKPIQQFYLERMLRKYLPEELAENLVEDENKEAQDKESEFTYDPLTLEESKGLEVVGGQMDAYCAVLNTYYKEGLRKLSDVRTELSEGNISLYTVDVHALKSSSASIGALGISERFKALEFAGRDNKTDYINAHTEETLEYFSLILDKVKDYLSDKGMYDGDEEEAELGELTDISLDAVLEMQDAINKINLRRCEEIINEMSAMNFGPDINSMIKSIKSSYEMFDYHKVKAYINDLIDKIS